MGKKDSSKEAVCVDDLINGVESCKINNNNSSKDYELSVMFKSMKIKDGDDKLWKPGEHKSQPKEDDESGNIGTRSEETLLTDNMVTLEAPSATDKEEDEDNNVESNVEVAITERGPMNGVRANYQPDIGLNYIASKPCKAYRMQGGVFAGNNYSAQMLPANFPDYSNSQVRTAHIKGTKREMDGCEVYLEPQKWVRPQIETIINNLNAPWNGPNSNMAAASGKPVSKVYQKQMSGGTVYTAEDTQFCSGSLDTQDSLELQDFLEMGIDGSGFNIPVEDFLPPSKPSSSQTIAAVDPGVVGLQWQQNQQSPLPPVSHLSAQKKFQQQLPYDSSYQVQMMQQYPEARPNGKRGSFGNDDYSDGYGSDLSPSHDTQTPSPGSVMDGSPAVYNGSPPRSNWSPPPSNMSLDSGVCSPMAEDQNGYTMQNMSPLHPPSPRQMLLDQAENEDYMHPYISKHLVDLESALEVASKDLMAEIRKGNPTNSFQTNEQYKCNIMMNMSNVSGPPQNFPSGIADPPISTIPLFARNQTVPATMKSQGMPTPPIMLTTVGVCQPVTTMANVRGPVMTATTNMAASTNKNNNVQPLIQTSVPGTLIITTAVSTVPQPPGNKIAIPPINSKPKITQSKVPIVLKNGTPVIIMPPNIQPQTTQRTPFRTIAPKDPAKQAEKTAATNIKPTNVPTNSSGAGQGEKSQNSVSSNKKKVAVSFVEKHLNLARRLVAEMSTDDLKFKDDDGDSYLHVAVCKADSYMVQALLERLVRENLTEMINSQNSQGQTPLYLAVSTNNAEMVKLLVDQGADVNPFAATPTPTGHIEKNAAIHCAASKGEEYLETLKALLKAPEINLNQVNTDGHTALNCAILSHGKITTKKTPVNSIPIIKALIHAGADPNLQVQQSGKTALMYTLESRDLDLIESTFQLVDPQKLPTFLKTQAFDSSSCQKIADSLKATLDLTGQQRLNNCLKPGNSRSIYGSSL